MQTKRAGRYFVEIERGASLVWLESDTMRYDGRGRPSRSAPADWIGSVVTQELAKKSCPGSRAARSCVRSSASSTAPMAATTSSDVAPPCAAGVRWNGAGVLQVSGDWLGYFRRLRVFRMLQPVLSNKDASDGRR